jgi:hypothetical protein
MIGPTVLRKVNRGRIPATWDNGRSIAQNAGSEPVGGESPRCRLVIHLVSPTVFEFRSERRRESAFFVLSRYKILEYFRLLSKFFLPTAEANGPSGMMGDLGMRFF